jgi:hypothetical protein
MIRVARPVRHRSKAGRLHRWATHSTATNVPPLVFATGTQCLLCTGLGVDVEELHSGVGALADVAFGHPLVGEEGARRLVLGQGPPKCHAGLR